MVASELNNSFYYVAYLSGKYPEFSYEELVACLEAEKINFDVKEKLAQLVLLRSTVDPTKAVKRCAYTHSLIRLIWKGHISPSNEINREDSYSLPHISDSAIAFEVRAKKIGPSNIKMKTEDLERQLAKYVFDGYADYDVKVNLKSPKYTFQAFIVGSSIFFGLLIYTLNKKDFTAREPGQRPIFRPGAMKSSFARALVNLSRISTDSIVYDPFCGSGGLLIEASLIGAYTLGSDVDYKAIKVSKVNVGYYSKTTHYSLIIADSRSLPLKKVDAIVTDPPYSIQSSTHGQDISRLIIAFLSNAKKVIKSRGYLVMSLPKKHQPEKLVKEMDMSIRTIIDARIHRSLTRRIIVVEIK